MCQLPKDPVKIKPLYQFLLQENYENKELVLSCTNQNIVLSLILYDLDLTIDNGAVIFTNLFQKADEYDDLLKKEYSCVERMEE